MFLCIAAKLFLFYTEAMINREQVDHIAKLARLGISEQEKEKFQQELSAILDFVEKLKEVNVEGVKPMTGGTDLTNVMREDGPAEKDLKQKEKFLSNAPKRKNDYVEVLAVFE